MTQLTHDRDPHELIRQFVIEASFHSLFPCLRQNQFHESLYGIFLPHITSLVHSTSSTAPMNFCTSTQPSETLHIYHPVTYRNFKKSSTLNFDEDFTFPLQTAYLLSEVPHEKIDDPPRPLAQAHHQSAKRLQVNFIQRNVITDCLYFYI